MTVPAGDGGDQGETQVQEPRQLREHVDRLTVDNKAKDDLIKDMAFQLAGVDITKGRGKTARTHYEGELSRDAVLAYMQENFDWEPEQPAAATPAVVLGNQIAEAQQRIQDTGQGPGTQSGNNEASIPQQIDEAEAKGDWQRAMALKKTWFGNLMFGKKDR